MTECVILSRGYMMQSNKLLNLADTIKGEINRMCVTDDVSELFSMSIHAEQNICKLCSMRYEDFKKRQEKLSCSGCKWEYETWALKCETCVRIATDNYEGG